jgi:hypothetical protein
MAAMLLLKTTSALTTWLSYISAVFYLESNTTWHSSITNRSNWPIDFFYYINRLNACPTAASSVTNTMFAHSGG